MRPIKNIIFDFGDVCINLEKQRLENKFKALGFEAYTKAMETVNHLFEKGLVSEEEFLNTFRASSAKANFIGIEDIKQAWNSLLGELPMHRVEFLESLVGSYQLFLLSNTDSIHIQHFETTYPKDLVSRFYACFDRVYFSFKMHQRKPDAAIYETVLKAHNLNMLETLFVDDKLENIKAASALGIQVWHLQVGRQEVVDLASKLKGL